MVKREQFNNQDQENLSSGMRNEHRKRRIVRSVLIGLIIVCILFLVPLPYYIYKPGSAEEIKPMVVIPGEAATGTRDEKGTFMLTTVRAETARIATYLLAMVHPYQELGLKEAAYQKGESQTEYTQRQVYVMRSSQSDAIQAAYLHAKIPYEITGDGIMVLRFVEGMQAESILKSGDTIIKLDDKPIAKTSELQEQLTKNKPGDIVKITYLRGDKTLTSELTLTSLKDENGDTGRVGLGILNPADLMSIKPEDPSKQVQVNVGAIGGPSAGLMFSLEIYNQLVPEDITKGYRIAGTGTITPEGKVGAIGGIQHKIIAADREKAEIFFAPADYKADNGGMYTNYSDALKRANQIGTTMKVVPVSTMDEALAYLATLPPK